MPLFGVGSLIVVPTMILTCLTVIILCTLSPRYIVYRSHLGERNPDSDGRKVAREALRRSAPALLLTR